VALKRVVRIPVTVRWKLDRTVPLASGAGRCGSRARGVPWTGSAVSCLVCCELDVAEPCRSLAELNEVTACWSFLLVARVGAESCSGS
jgi:hypothetical protein